MSSTVDEKTLLTAVRTAIRALTWTVGVNIFASQSVRITSAMKESAIAKLREPICLIRPGDGQNDDDEPSLIHGSFSITLIHRIANDEIGEAPLMGAGNRTAKSLLDVQRRVVGALAKMNRDDGVPIVAAGRSAARAELDEQSNYVASRDYAFRAEFSNDEGDET